MLWKQEPPKLTCISKADDLRGTWCGQTRVTRAPAALHPSAYVTREWVFLSPRDINKACDRETTVSHEINVLRLAKSWWITPHIHNNKYRVSFRVLTSAHRIWKATETRSTGFTCIAMESESADLFSSRSFIKQPFIFWMRVCSQVKSCLMGGHSKNVWPMSWPLSMNARVKQFFMYSMGSINNFWHVPFGGLAVVSYFISSISPETVLLRVIMDMLLVEIDSKTVSFKRWSNSVPGDQE